MNRAGSARLVRGDCQAMSLLRDGEVDLVLTSPPYTPSDLEDRLFSRTPSTDGAEAVRESLLSFAESFRPHLREIDRVLAPHGVLVLQLKDIWYGGMIIRIVDRHTSLAEDLGLRLLGRSWWRCTFEHPRVQAASAFGSIREPEQFLVFGRSEIASDARHGDESLVPDAIAKSAFWTTPGEGARKRMRFQSPQIVMKALIDMYSDHGDLVVDPFAGSGETLWTAAKMGRQAIGYELDQLLVDQFQVVMERR